MTITVSTASWNYVRRGPLASGEFEVALARLGTAADEDLYRYFHSKGALNLTGVSDQQLDAALVRYREATTRVDRDLAKQAIATRMGDLKPVSVIHAPASVLLVSRRVTGIDFEDDLPQLHTLGVVQGPDPWLLEK